MNGDLSTISAYMNGDLQSDKYALLIKGARRVGKSTIAEEFAKKEFKSYIMIDFAHTSKEIKNLFEDTYDLDFFFLQLQQLTKTLVLQAAHARDFSHGLAALIQVRKHRL